MKKLALLTLMIACVAFVFVSCAGGGAGGVDIVINENDPTVVKDGSTLAPNTMVKFAWTDPNGNPVTCDVILEKDGVKVEEFEGVTEVLTGIREEGHYKAYIIPVNASGSRAAKIIRFTVNKMYEELYKEDSGRYQWVDVSEACYNAYLEEENAKIYFYKLEGKVVEATDLRAGACLVIAGLIAAGKTVINNAEHILRGYSNIVEKLKNVGADIEIEENC